MSKTKTYLPLIFASIAFLTCLLYSIKAIDNLSDELLSYFSYHWHHWVHISASILAATAFIYIYKHKNFVVAKKLWLICGILAIVFIIAAIAENVIRENTFFKFVAISVIFLSLSFFSSREKHVYSSDRGIAERQANMQQNTKEQRDSDKGFLLAKVFSCTAVLAYIALSILTLDDFDYSMSLLVESGWRDWLAFVITGFGLLSLIVVMVKKDYLVAETLWISAGLFGVLNIIGMATYDDWSPPAFIYVVFILGSGLFFGSAFLSKKQRQLHVV